MAVIVKNPVAFRCKNFAQRYRNHEASALLEEAAALIEEMDEELAEFRLAETRRSEGHPYFDPKLIDAMIDNSIEPIIP